MGGNLKDRWSVPSTVVAHEFIDEYMAAANGEYVKVYLYVLRHQDEEITIEQIADALNHTESDVRRALSYWEKQGVITAAMEGRQGDCPECREVPRSSGQTAGDRGLKDGSLREAPLRNQGAREYAVREQGIYDPVGREQHGRGQGCTEQNPPGHNSMAQSSIVQSRMAQSSMAQSSAAQSGMKQNSVGQNDAGQNSTGQNPMGQNPTGQNLMGRNAMAQNPAGQASGEPTIEVREAGDTPVYSAEQVNRLSQDEEFSQLLYIAQKYMNKVFTPRDCQVFAYLYEDLGMGSELLEYLVEYCVQNGHTSVRYIEAVARNWHEKGIRTAQEAKDYSSAYNKDSFAVMKAFGINSRKPAAPEQKLMDKWFRDYGFTREVVLEACDRTITAIHNPSFQYADKILTDWKKSGVRVLGDIRELDHKRMADKEQNAQARDKRLQKYDTGVSTQGSRPRKGAPNQFHNFEQRDTDYDALMLKQVKEWVGQQQ